MDNFCFEVLFQHALGALEGFKRRVILGQDPTSAFHEVRRELRDERESIIRGFKWASPWRRSVAMDRWPGLRDAFEHALNLLGEDRGFEAALAEMQSHLLLQAQLTHKS